MILKSRHYLLLSSIALIMGMFFYGVYNDLIIFHFHAKKATGPVKSGPAQRKVVKLTYWNGSQFITEEKELLIANNIQRAIQDLVAGWLSLLDQEGLLPEKTTVQPVMMDASSKEAFVSFDRSPLLKGASTYDKLQFIEGLLRTFKENKIPVMGLRFLIQHKRFNDPHLDFAQAWPITGYATPQV